MIGYGNSYFISTILDSGGGVSGIPVNTVAPVISGGTSLGSVLSSTTGTWTGDPTITYAYQWKRNGNNIGGATNSTYTITIFDTGANITCTITATNGVGSTQATSNTINVQAFSAPVNTVAPVISGTATVGYSLSSTDGTWTGNPTPTYTYQWYRGATLIGGATSNTYTLVNADEGQSITCQVTGTNGIGSSTATSNALTVSSLLLDLYPSSAVAYSLRKLRTAYSGSAIRVRRSSDNAEQDIAFSGNDLNTASLLTFCGAGNGFISEWYDQSTNANKAIQTTPTNQAQIVSNGNLILDANTSKITTTWTADRYSLTSGIDTNTKYFSISMFRRGTNTSDALVHLGSSAANNPCPLVWLGTGSSYAVNSRMPSLLNFENVSTTGRCIMTSLRDGSNLKVAYRNGIQLTNTATEAPTSQTLNTFGQNLTNYTSGQYQEYIYWNSEQSANRIGIENNIKTYWNAY